MEQSVERDDLQQEPPGAGDLYIYILPVSARSWFVGETVLSVRVVTQLFYSAAKRNRATQKQWIESPERINSDMEKYFNTFASHSANCVAGSLGV